MGEPQVLFGAGSAHVTPTRDAKGNKIAVPQVISLPEVMDINAGFGKSDVKTAHGQRQYAIHAARGKSTIEVSFTCGETYLRAINALYFGQTVKSGSHRIYRDSTGTEIPEGSRTQIKINTKKTFHLGKWVSNTSVAIAGSNATLATGATIFTGQYKVSGGRYSFSASDVGKEAKLTYVVAGGATVVSTFKIPPTLSFSTVLLTKVNSVNKTNVTGYFTRDTYNPAGIAPIVAHYQASANGIMVFAPTEAVSVTISHNTNGVAVSSLVASLPAAGYNCIIDPPSSALFVGNIGIELVSDYGTAMTGVAVGETLTQSATPTSGQYDLSNVGIYTFAAADAGDDVRISYTTDFMFLTVSPPGDGEFIADKGVVNTDGLPLTRVELTSPISLLRDQYAVSGAGDYYFDNSNRGDTVYIDYEYATAEGGTLVIENLDMGSTPRVALDISGSAEGQEWLVQYPNAIPKSYEFATKTDDFAQYKITFEVVADRRSRTVGTLYMVA